MDRLARAGADFAAITANMPHLAFNDVAARSPIPLVSIIATCADAAEAHGVVRWALLGTRFTMEASMYPDELGRRGIQVVTPSEPERAFIHDHYVDELLKGKFRPEVRQRVETIVARLRDEEGIDGVILGGTELARLLSAIVAELPAFNTMALRVDAIATPGVNWGLKFRSWQQSIVGPLQSTASQWRSDSAQDRRRPRFVEAIRSRSNFIFRGRATGMLAFRSDIAPPRQTNVVGCA